NSTRPVSAERCCRPHRCAPPVRQSRRWGTHRTWDTGKRSSSCPSPPCGVVGLRSRSDVHALLVQLFEDGALADRATARASGDEPRQRLLHGVETPDLLLNVSELRFGPRPHL